MIGMQSLRPMKKHLLHSNLLRSLVILTGLAQVSFAVNSGDTSGIPAAGAYLNAISNPGDPFDIHVIDLAGHRIGTAPKACSSL